MRANRLLQSWVAVILNPVSSVVGSSFGVAPAKITNVGIADPVRSRNEDFISRTNKGMKGVEKNMLAPTAGGDFWECIAKIVLPLELRR